jgi:hypothetical protein
VSTPSPARLYNYYLGGTDNFAADREAADAILAVMPEGRRVARENRRSFLRRVVGHLTAEEGIRQFIDLGTGLPTQARRRGQSRLTAPWAASQSLREETVKPSR